MGDVGDSYKESREDGTGVGREHLQTKMWF